MGTEKKEKEHSQRGFLKTFLGRFYDPEASNTTIDRIVDNLADHLPEVLDESGVILLRSLQKRVRSMLRKRHRESAGFRKRLRKKWGEALDLLQMCIALATEAGDMFTRECRPADDEQIDYRFEALVRLHARACQVGSEVHELLAAGFADGAHARWRTAHELAIIAFFISVRPAEVAERYLMHKAIQSHRDAIEYQKHAEHLGYEPFTDEDLQSIQVERDAACERYGPDFGHAYGWASQELGNPRPTFLDVEASIEMEHFRPYYRMASQNVHAGPESLFFRLGNPDARTTLLAGGSDAGLAAPGQATAISLHQATTALLLSSPTYERFAVLEAFRQLVDKTMTAFIDAHASLL